MAQNQDFEYGNTLGRNPESVLPELLKHLFKSNLRIWHLLTNFLYGKLLLIAYLKAISLSIKI